jgi:hypothetical protein
MDGKGWLGVLAAALPLALVTGACSAPAGSHPYYQNGSTGHGTNGGGTNAGATNGGGTNGGGTNGGGTNGGGTNGGGTNGGDGNGSGSQGRTACTSYPYGTTGKTFENLMYDLDKHLGAANSESFKVPSPQDRDAFAQQVMAALAFDGDAPCPLPSSYVVLSMKDGNDDVRIVGEFDKYGTSAPQLFWGAYAARRPGSGTRPLVIEAPHPLADPDSATESARVFSASRAEWYMIAGAHRCSNAATSGCDGTTGVCTGAQAPYRQADAAHSTDTPFYAMHALLSDMTTAPFLQLHTNGEKCPAALVADGSGSWPANGLAATLATSLEQAGASVGRCGMDFPTAACSLCATENVEGRATAGSGEACTTAGSDYSRFVHVEQQNSLVAASGDMPVITAVIATFKPR